MYASKLNQKDDQRGETVQSASHTLTHGNHIHVYVHAHKSILGMTDRND